MRVLQVIDSLSIGGAEVLAVNIANGLSEKKIDSHICVTRVEGELKENINSSVGYIYLNRKKSIEIKAIKKLKRYVKEHKIEIIHTHNTSIFFIFCFSFFIKNVNFIWHNHTGDYVNLKGLKFIFIKWFSFIYSKIICVNEDLNTWSLNKLNHKNSIKLNNFPEFVDTSKKTILRGKIGNKIVCLAALRPEKDHINLLKAFYINYAKYPNWTLHLVGKDYNDNYSKKIKQFITSNKLDYNVFIYDLQRDIKNILLQSNIGVLQSKNEGLPISILEYGLAKLPVVVTDVGECKKIVKHQKSGLIVDRENSLQLALALEELILSKEKRIYFGKNHQKNITEKYSKDIFFKKLLKIYTS
ncbi:glycosyltransferase [uncultured Polaribacter sp.]|uniref:glycosyltransferase n=1 Tax=uncultured Polaribacter sp. TaxID=174711 RepID=UPI00261BA259|nr:glycosyltransferase [uncultured Polaribacter sp.]